MANSTQASINIGIIIVSIIIIILCTKCLMKSSERFVPYPFGPIDPNHVDPIVAQSVFGQPSVLFQLSNSPQNQNLGAWQALQLSQNMYDWNRNAGIEWQTNDGFSSTGNTQFLLDYANPPYYAWRNF
jgi:hypothetical protein